MDSILNLLPLKVQQAAKAILAFVSALGTAIVVLAADSDFTQWLPETWGGKLAGLGAALVAFGAIFGIRNLRTVKQAQDDLRRAKNVAAKPRKRAARKSQPPAA